MAAVLGQMHMYGWNGWWMGIGMLAFWAVVIGATAVLAASLTRASTRGTRRDRDSRHARELLAERYAAGDIDTEEFQTRSRELEKVSQ